MIHTSRTVAVGTQESTINTPIILYRGDREVEVEFGLQGSKFMFSNGGDVIKSTNATHGQLVINTPTGGNMFSEVTECRDGKVVFVITKEMIDELIEVGFYSFQIRLFDENQLSRVTVPPVLKGIDIRNPIAAEDETNVVDIGLVDYAVVVKDEFEDLSTFLPDNNYNKTEWESKDVISAAKLNKIEDALYIINGNMESSDLALFNRVENINSGIQSDFKTLNNNVHTALDDITRELNKTIDTFKVDTKAQIQYVNEIAEDIDIRKANIRDVRMKSDELNLNDFDEETRAAIQGLEPGKINAVLGDRNVKYTNTDFVEIKLDNSPFTPINLYNKKYISEVGYFANLTDGNIVNTEYTQNYVNTGFIKCHNTVRYALTSVSNLCLYDKDKNFLSSISGMENLEVITIDDIKGRLLNVPEGCEYIICNLDKNYLDYVHIWQLDRFQYTDDCTLTIPRLDLYKNSVFSINGKEAIKNNINLTAMDVGALEPIKKLISKSLPCVLGDELRGSRGAIHTTSDLGTDLLIAKSINEFNINDYEYSSVLCDYTIDTDNYSFTISTDGAIAGWYQSYVDIPISGLTGDAEYTLYSKISALSGYPSTLDVRGLNVFDSSMNSLVSMDKYATKVSFNVPSDGYIVLRLYPASAPHDGTTTLISKFENIMLCKNNKAVSTFIPYSEQKIQLQGNDIAYINLLPLMIIETEYNIYNNNIEIYRLQDAGKVNTVNDCIPDEYGNVDIPKTILANKKIVCFGDSITEFGTYPEQVGDILGATTYNVGVGGCRMSYHTNSSYDGFSMTKLADAITSRDFSLQKQCHGELMDISDDNTKSYETLININFEEIDYITIAFGTNDFGGAVALGTIDSEANDSTFYGAIKYVIETILTTYPHIKLFFMTPIFRWSIPGVGTNSDITPIYGKYLNDYAKAIIDVCYKYHIPVLDMYNKSNINALNYAYYISSDGTHPTEEGYTLIAEKLSKFLLSN